MEFKKIQDTKYKKIATGNSMLDGFLEGGFESGILTTLYGPSASGKTNLCLIALASVLKSRKKAIYIDTEGGVSVARLKQILDNDQELLENIFFLPVKNFEEQKKAFKLLNEQLPDEIGLIVIDSISMLYRLEIGNTHDIHEVNKQMGLQVSHLVELARKKNIPILATSQVYANFENKEKINLVGGDILKYSSKCLIELRSGINGIRLAIINKHRSIPEGKNTKFKIVSNGIESVN